jgi:hypothetical protein
MAMVRRKMSNEFIKPATLFGIIPKELMPTHMMKRMASQGKARFFIAVVAVRFGLFRGGKLGEPESHADENGNQKHHAQHLYDDCNIPGLCLYRIPGGGCMRRLVHGQTHP